MVGIRCTEDQGVPNLLLGFSPIALESAVILWEAVIW